MILTYFSFYSLKLALSGVFPVNSAESHRSCSSLHSLFNSRNFRENPPPLRKQFLRNRALAGLKPIISFSYKINNLNYEKQEMQLRWVSVGYLRALSGAVCINEM